MEDAFFPFKIFMCDINEYMIALALCDLFDAIHGLRKEIVFDLRDDHSDRLALALTQAAGKGIGLETKLRGQFLYPFFCVCVGCIFDWRGGEKKKKRGGGAGAGGEKGYLLCGCVG